MSMILIHELHLFQVVTLLLVSTVAIAVWFVNSKQFIFLTNQTNQVYYKAKGQLVCSVNNLRTESNE